MDLQKSYDPRYHPLTRLVTQITSSLGAARSSNFRVQGGLSMGFISGQRGSQLLLDTDGYLYTRRKDRDTSTTSAW